MKKLLVIVLALAMVFCMFACGQKEVDPAENFPEQSINLVIGFTAGGGCDNVHRLIQPKVEAALGGTFTIDNQPGANGGLAVAGVIATEPNGYNMVGVTVGPATITPIMQPDLGYTNEDVIPCCQLAELVVGWACRAGEWNSVQEVIDYAKAHPGELKFSHSGIGSIHHVTLLKIEQSLGVPGLFTQVPYGGTADAFTAMLGGDVDFCMGEASAFSSQADAGACTILATMGKERSEFFPNVPTMIECGFNVESTIWVGNAFPKGTPESIVKKVSDAFGVAAKDPEILKSFADKKIPFVYMDKDAFAEKWNREWNENVVLLKDFVSK